MRKPVVLLSLLLISLIQSCSPSIKTQCERIVSAHEWAYSEMRKNETIQGVNAEQSDSFYADQIERKKALSKEAQMHLKALKTKYSNQTLKLNASSASKDLKFMTKYYENAIRILEFYSQLENGSNKDVADIQEARELAHRQEDYLAHMDTHSLQLRKLDEAKGYCAQK